MAEPSTLEAAERLLSTLGAGRAAMLQLAAQHLDFSQLTSVSAALGNERGRIAELHDSLDRRINVLRGRLLHPPVERTDDDATPQDASLAANVADEPHPVATPSRLQRNMLVGRQREAAVPAAARTAERRGLPAARTPAAPTEAPLIVEVAPPPAATPSAVPAIGAAPVSEIAPAPEEPPTLAFSLADEPVDETLDELLVDDSPELLEAAEADPAAEAEAAPQGGASIHAFAPAGPRLVAAAARVAEEDEDEDEDEDGIQAAPAAVSIAASRPVQPTAVRPAGPSAGDDDLAAGGEDDDDALLGAGIAAPGGGIRLGAPTKPRRTSDPGEGPRLTDDDESPSVTQAPAAPNIQPAGDDGRIAQLMEDAVVAAGKGDLHKSIQAFTDVLDLRHDRSDAYIGRGRCYLELGDYSSAMSDFQRAEDLHPDRPDAHVAMGDLYFARKEYRRAIEFYDQAVELDGSHAMARCRRGISHYYRKNYRQAFQDLQRAYSLDPEIPNIRKYVQMAVKKMERGD